MNDRLESISRHFDADPSDDHVDVKEEISKIESEWAAMICRSRGHKGAKGDIRGDRQ
jgi:hypothetical protein